MFLLGETGEYMIDVEPGEDELATGKGFIKYVYKKKLNTINKFLLLNFVDLNFHKNQW